MSDWHPLSIDPDDNAHNEERWRSRPPPLTARLRKPEHYIPHPALIEAINTAILLGQPLLVTGEPGCGKTELGNYVAWKLGLGRALRYDTKSDTQASDLFYAFDTLRRFRDARPDGNGGEDLQALKYVRLNALGAAVTIASDSPHRKRLLDSASEDLCDDLGGEDRRPSVVLIDEIDKAPRDVPNDLLAEIERLAFAIREAGVRVAARPDLQPVMVLTSNSEKALPDAFLRRCVYYHIPFPDRATLADIVATRVRDADGTTPAPALVSDAIDVITHLRENRSLRKRPGTAELMSFLLALREATRGPDVGLQGHSDWYALAAITMLKAREDQQSAERHFETVAWSQPAG